MLCSNSTNKKIKRGAKHIEITSQGDAKNKIKHVKVQTQVNGGAILVCDAGCNNNNLDTFYTFISTSENESIK